MSYHAMNDDELLRRYLLDQLDPEQKDDLERRLLADDALFELAEAIEGDLLHAAAVGRDLLPAERGHVLRRLAASPDGRARLALAHGLATLDQERTVAEVLVFKILSRPSLRAAAVAASLVMTAGGAWLATRFAIPEGGAHMIARGLPAAREPEAPARPHVQPLGRMAAKPPAPQAPAPPAPRPEAAPVEERPAEQRAPRVAPEARDWVFQLALTTVRDATDVPLLTIPPGRNRVQIRLPLAEEEPATEFSILLRDMDTGEEIRKDESLAARPANGGRAVFLTVPAADLPEGTYEIEVRAVAPEDDLLGRPTFEVRAP